MNQTEQTADVLSADRIPEQGAWYKTRGRDLNGNIAHTCYSVSRETDSEGVEHTILFIRRYTLVQKEMADKMYYPQSKRVFKGYVISHQIFSMKFATLWDILDHIRISDLGSDFKVIGTENNTHH